jgi:hypothetical protein
MVSPAVAAVYASLIVRYTEAVPFWTTKLCCDSAADTTSRHREKEISVRFIFFNLSD